MNRKKIILTVMTTVICSVFFCGCNGYNPTSEQPMTNIQKSEADEEVEKSKVGETDQHSENEEKTDAKPTQSLASSDGGVDVLFFMGESNMSGFGGDASLAPKISEDAGLEFRAVSEPTGLYPIIEPFGKNESISGGLDDYPGTKKGSLVSAFVNEYHKLSGKRVVAVSASMGSTDMDMWTSEGIMTDVKERFDSTLSYLKDNGYNVGHIYVIWLQGESDGLKGAAEETYKEGIEYVMKPLFKAGLEKVFIIVPGRTIDSVDAYVNVINAEIDMCIEKKDYALATTALTKVSTECMTDQYQYNQHALNYIGIEAAKSVAYYTENGVEKIVYDYKQGRWIAPKGINVESQEREDLVYPSELDINKMF